MNKYILLFNLIIFISCNKGSEKSNLPLISITNVSLIKVLENFQEKNFNNDGIHTGVIGLKSFKFCRSTIFEIWKIRTIHSFNFDRLCGYFLINELPVFIFDNNTNLYSDSFDNHKVITKIANKFIVTDIDLMPPTEFAPRILFNESRNNIFNINDTLFRYDDSIIFNKKLLEYTGNISCY